MTPSQRSPLRDDPDSSHGFFNPNPDPRFDLYDKKVIFYKNQDNPTSPSQIRYNYTRHGRQSSWDWHNPMTERFPPDISANRWFSCGGHADLDNTVFEEFLWQQGSCQTSPTPARPRQPANLLVNPPRCSGQQRQPVHWPDNFYGDEAPIDILQNYDAFDVSRPSSDQSPDRQEGPSGHMGSNLLTNWEPKANTEKATAAEITHYQSIIGSLLYLMIGTRPDIVFTVTHLSQFSTNPTEDHYKAAQHVCHYLVGTCDYKLVYTHEEDKGLVSYTDSDWAADKIWHHSVTGYFFKLANGIISWRSHAQKTIALSSMEAKYMVISDCSRQAIWIKTLIKELGIKIKFIPIYGDNQGSIFIASIAVQESHTKHINICYHYICELVVAKEVELQFVPGEMNPADMFTKNLQKIFTQFQIS